MASTTTNKEVEKELLPLVRVYKDGSVERLLGSPYVPPSSPDADPTTGVSSKDITNISQNPAISLSARLYLPKLTDHHQKLPIFVYFHGGGFCIESAFSFLNHRYLNILVSEARVLAVSVEYRLAPEHPLPAAYEDCWAALQWVASHRNKIDDHENYSSNNKEAWLLNHGDFERVFIGGDSAGGNIVHNIAMRAGEGDHDNQESSLKESTGVKILGAFLGHPYFWGSNPIGSEPVGDNRENNFLHLSWEFVYPTAPGGIDNPMVNPVGEGKPNLAKLGCSRLLVCVAENDQLRDRGIWYFNAVKESGFQGEAELFEVKGEDHAFHFFNPKTEIAKIMFQTLSSFLNN